MRSLLNKNPIYSITPFTTLDFPDKISAIAWFSGCNMRCAYCYNVAVVLGWDKKAQISAQKEQNFGVSELEFLEFLDSRKGKLNGIVFSGGECTISSAFLSLAREVKARGFALKVDTNGSNLSALKTAISENLIDYIALDFKALKDKFKAITDSNLYENFIASLEFLVSSGLNFEVRTSIHADFLNESDIAKMAQILYDKGYRNDYYLQKFLNTGENFKNLSEPKNSFDPFKIISPLPIKLRNF